MKNLSDIEKELKTGPNSRAIMDAAGSGEAQRLAKSLDRKAVEDAVRSGDSEKLKALLAQVLNNPDGRALAERINRTMNNK